MTVTGDWQVRVVAQAFADDQIVMIEWNTKREIETSQSVNVQYIGYTKIWCRLITEKS